MRELMASHKEILKRLYHLENKGIEYEDKIALVFEYLKKLKTATQREVLQKNRPRIGFKPLRSN